MCCKESGVNKGDRDGEGGVGGVGGGSGLYRGTGKTTRRDKTTGTLRSRRYL